MSEMRIEVPDVQMFVLPGRAYLRSLLEQNLPTRRAALQDARGYFDSVTDAYETRLALVALIGEAMQLVEDVGAIGNAFFNSPEGVGFFALAATYDPSAINLFYDRLHKREFSDFTRLAALAFGGRWVHTTFIGRPEASGVEEAATVAAHEMTAALLRDELLFLRDQWHQFRPYFHAFKHGMLVGDPRDLVVVADDQITEIEKIVVWRRKRQSPECYASIEPPFAPIADLAESAGRRALEVIDFLARQRLKLISHVEIHDDGTWTPLSTNELPWIWWLTPDELPAEVREALTRRWGISWSNSNDRGDKASNGGTDQTENSCDGS